MRSFFIGVVLLGLLTGCAAHQSDLGIPDGEAIYDMPLEEAWPSVQQFFTDNGLSYREDPGTFVLETEWREEFGASKVSGFWHRYMVLGKRETPTTSKLWIVRVTRSMNGALQSEGSKIEWGKGDTKDLTSASSTMNPDGFGQVAAYGDLPGQMFDGDNGITARSAQGQRDLVMEWKVFHGIESKLKAQAELARAKQEAREAQLARAAAVRAKAEEEAKALAVECGMPIIGLAPRAKPGALLLMGELHGTQEVPRFVAQGVCQVAQNGQPVTVGLELPVETQERVERFIASAGTEEDWLKLMEASFWRSPFPDGRGSEAVANLLEQLRSMRAHGMDVRAFVFDHPELKGQERETAMANSVLAQMKQGPKRFYMVVSGNIHPRTTKGLPWDKQYRPMGLLLSKTLDEDDVVALDMAYDSGSAWICAPDPKSLTGKLECGVRAAKGHDNGDRPFIHLWKSGVTEGFHGVFYVGKVTASVPAVNRGLGRPGSNDNSNQLGEPVGPAFAVQP